MNTLPLVEPARALEYFEDKLKFTTGPVELDEMIKSHGDITIIDVREEEDYAKGHISGAINLPRDRWATMEGLSSDKLNVIYCYNQQCHLGAKACRDFAQDGFSVMELEGGFEMWKERGMDVVRPQENRFSKLLEGFGRYHPMT